VVIGGEAGQSSAIQKGGAILRLHSLEAERLSSGRFIPPWVRNEHAARYTFAERFVEGREVVDCACGVGEGTAHFLRTGAKRIHAFDVSESSIETARKTCVSPSVEFRVADALNLPMEAESADVFISLETIEHIQEDVDFIREISRILRPDGLLVCSTPNRSLTNPGLDLNEQPFNPFHIREYSAGEFNDLLGECFSEVTLYGQNPRSRGYARAFAAAGKLTPFRGATRINQILKLPRLIRYNRAYATVVEMQPSYEYEYVVAVCRKPSR
jgi:SAM-dependent methyltransferase